MKKLFYISCALLCLFAENSTFAAQKSRCYTTACRAQSLSLEQPSISEEKCIAEINRVRQEHGLRPLKAWKELSNCARGHSQNMASNKCSFGHDGFDKRAKQMQKQATLASFAENVAYSYNYDDPVKVAVDGWMKSPGHRKNILDEGSEETGVGVAHSKDGKFYITQLFAKRY